MTINPIYEIDLVPRVEQLHARLMPQLIDLFLKELLRTTQEKTVYGYRAKLKHVLDWWEVAGPELDWILDADGLTALNRHLETIISDRGEVLSYHSRHDVLRRLRQVLHWAYQHKYIAFNLARDVPAPRGMPPTRKPVDLTALAKLFEAARQGNNPGRDVAIIAMLAGTGIRCEECASLRVSDVTLHADGSGYARLRITKHDIPRVVAIDRATGVYLRPWLDEFEDPSAPLFPSRNGQGKAAISPMGLYKIIARLAEAAGVRDQVQGAHDLRRMFATLWLRQLPGEGYGQLLQMQLGHATFATTQKYSLQDAGRVLEVMCQQAASPIAQLSHASIPESGATT